MLNWLGLLAVGLSLGLGPTSQPANSGGPELTSLQQNLLMQLADAEANIQAINRSLKDAGYKVGIAYDRIDSNLKGNEYMDRKGGGPVRWDEFYGKTARDYARNGNGWYGDHRPKQFAFVYKANNDQIARAKDQIASLKQDQTALLDRRQKHEADQSRLWANLAWERVKDREINLQPLYRFALKPAGPEAAVLRPIILFLRTSDAVATEGLSSIQSDQAGTFQFGSKTMAAAFATLQKSLADASDGENLKPDELRTEKSLKQICKDLAEQCKVIAEDYDNALDRDKAREDGSKLEFRGQLQSSLTTFAAEVGQLDDEIARTARDWGISADHGTPTPDSLTSSLASLPGAANTLHSSTIDVLKLLDPARDTLSGQWKAGANGMTGIGAGKWALIRLSTACPLPAEYDYRIVFVRNGGNDGLWQFTPWGALMIGFDVNKHTALVQTSVKGPETIHTKQQWLVNGRQYESLIKVRKDQVEAFIDGVSVATLKLAEEDLKHNAESRRLGFGLFNNFTIESAQISEYTGAPEPAAK